MRFQSFLLFLFCCAWGQAAAAKPSIAVLTFKGDNTVTPEQLAFISTKFASELISSKAFTVLDRNRMDAILAEQGFQQSGSCNSTDCNVQVGQLLGVEKLVTGNMVRFGTEYAISIEYLDVATGEIVKSFTFEASGDLQTAYKDACRRGAQLLIDYVQPASPSATPVEKSPTPEPAQKDKSKPWAWQKVVGTLGFGTSAALLGTGLYFDNQASVSIKERNKRLDTYDAFIKANYGMASFDVDKANSLWQDYMEKRSKAKDQVLYRNLCYGLSGGALAVSALLWFWHASDEKQPSSQAFHFIALPGLVAMQASF